MIDSTGNRLFLLSKNSRTLQDFFQIGNPGTKTIKTSPVCIDRFVRRGNFVSEPLIPQMIMSVRNKEYFTLITSFHCYIYLNSLPIIHMIFSQDVPELVYGIVLILLSTYFPSYLPGNL